MRGKGKGRGRQTYINKQKKLVGGKIQWKEIKIRIKRVLCGKIQFRDFRLFDAKQWVHKIIANELDMQPSYHNTGSQ
jgi:hypothetical protein